MDKPIVRVGMGVFVFKDGKFIVQKRTNAHGEGTWSVPGGHVEFGELLEETARREVKEETNLDIKNIAVAGITNDIFKEESKHYITIWVTSDWAAGEAYITEPDKCIGQEWCDFDSLPPPLFLPWQQLFVADFYKSIQDRAKRAA